MDSRFNGRGVSWLARTRPFRHVGDDGPIPTLKKSPRRRALTHLYRRGQLPARLDPPRDLVADRMSAASPGDRATKEHQDLWSGRGLYVALSVQTRHSVQRGHLRRIFGRHCATIPKAGRASCTGQPQQAQVRPAAAGGATISTLIYRSLTNSRRPSPRTRWPLSHFWRDIAAPLSVKSATPALSRQCCRQSCFRWWVGLADRDGIAYSGPLKHWLEVYQLPPYSPEFNATERMWQHTRRNGTHNRYFKTEDELVGTLTRVFGTMQENPESISGYLRPFC